MFARLRTLLQVLVARLTRRAFAAGVEGVSAKGAAQLGISLAAFAFLAGLALGGLPAGGVGYALGRAVSGFAAERNRLARDAAEARVDRDAALSARAAAHDYALNAAAMAAQARTRLDAYEKELRRLGPLGACGLTDRDIARLRDRVGPVEPGARRAPPPARR